MIMEVAFILSGLVPASTKLYLLTFTFQYCLLEAANGSINLQAKHDLDNRVLI